MTATVADPGFPRLGAPIPKIGASSYYFGHFPKNYMKMKRNLDRGRAFLAPLDLPMNKRTSSFNLRDYSFKRKVVMEEKWRENTPVSN